MQSVLTLFATRVLTFGGRSSPSVGRGGHADEGEGERQDRAATPEEGAKDGDDMEKEEEAAGEGTVAGAGGDGPEDSSKPGDSGEGGEGEAPSPGKQAEVVDDEEDL